VAKEIFMSNNNIKYEDAEEILASIKDFESSPFDYDHDFENMVNYDKVIESWNTRELLDEAYIEEVVEPFWANHICLSMTIRPEQFEDIDTLNKSIEKSFKKIGIDLEIDKCHFEPILIENGVVSYDVYPMDYLSINPCEEGINIYKRYCKEVDRSNELTPKQVDALIKEYGSKYDNDYHSKTYSIRLEYISTVLASAIGKQDFPTDFWVEELRPSISKLLERDEKYVEKHFAHQLFNWGGN
jgi:hypothetical protein